MPRERLHSRKLRSFSETGVPVIAGATPPGREVLRLWPAGLKVEQRVVLGGLIALGIARDASCRFPGPPAPGATIPFPISACIWRWRLPVAGNSPASRCAICRSAFALLVVAGTVVVLSWRGVAFRGPRPKAGDPAAAGRDTARSTGSSTSICATTTPSPKRYLLADRAYGGPTFWP